MSEQPKEYIITEEQLDHFVTCAAHDDCTGCKYSAPEFVCVPRIMANKVRSRPAPAPVCPYSAEEDMCLECKAHEERIAAKARREVLDVIEKWSDNEVYGVDDEGYDATPVVSYLGLEHLIKSLREGAK